MTKVQFRVLLREARERKSLSLRSLANRVGIEYSRLAKMESGTRPAPGLAEIRRLADILDLDMGDLLVAAGTSREVMEHLLWSERLHPNLPGKDLRAYVPERSSLIAKNAFRVRVLRRDGALCTVTLGGTKLSVFSFAGVENLSIHIPPEAVFIHRVAPGPASSGSENILPTRVKKVRRFGQMANLVLAGDGFELNTLHTDRTIDRLGISEGDAVFASVQATAIRTEASSKEA